jgi:hypothetical protein
MEWGKSMSNYKSDGDLSRRAAFGRLGTAIAGAFCCTATTQAQAQTGGCVRCSCPVFIGAYPGAFTCQRCAHSWADHTR